MTSWIDFKGLYNADFNLKFIELFYGVIKLHFEMVPVVSWNRKHCVWWRCSHLQEGSCSILVFLWQHILALGASLDVLLAALSQLAQNSATPRQVLPADSCNSEPMQARQL